MHIISHKRPWKQPTSSDHAPRRWQPGEPLPKGHAPNPHDALVRNAYAAEMEEQRRRFNDRRQPRTADRRAA